MSASLIEHFWFFISKLDLAAVTGLSAGTRKRVRLDDLALGHNEDGNRQDAESKTAQYFLSPTARQRTEKFILCHDFPVTERR